MESVRKRKDGHSVAGVKSLIWCPPLAASGAGALSGLKDCFKKL